MSQVSIDLPTADGACRTALFRPAGAGPWPAVLFFMDGIGPRPALYAMGERLAAQGYLVVLPDLFYRVGPYTTQELWELLGNAERRGEWRARFHASASDPAHLRTDVGAVLDYLATRPEVRQPRVGTTGYCMGGNLSLRAAGTYPERIAAAASFHGGYLATDGEDSPHRLAPRMKAQVYVAGAVEDASFPEEQKQRLVQALRDAGVVHTVETYEGARHGWAVSDTPVYNAAAAERHWTALLELFERTLR